MAALDLMTLDDGSGDFLLDDGEFVLGDDAGQDCCCGEGTCCPNDIVFPGIAGDPDATELEGEIIDVFIGTGECCLTAGHIGSKFTFEPSAPLFWRSCDIDPTCATGVVLTCLNNTFDLQWKTDACPLLPANPVANESWELVSIQCDPFELIFDYIFTQFFPNPCENWGLRIKITKKPPP